MGMKVSQFYRASSYMNATDIGRDRPRGTISSCIDEGIADEQKIVVYFHEEGHEAFSKGLVLNRTNAMTIADAYGDDTDAWSGKELELYVTKTPYQGRNVDALRVRPVSPQSSYDELTKPKK